MQHSKLSDHVFKKGTFITPFNSIETMQELADEKSWTYGRLPEYLWIGLILKHFGRECGLRKLYSIISFLHRIAPDLSTARMSQILKLDQTIQRDLFQYIISLGAKDALEPLTIYLTASRAPIFAELFFSGDYSANDRCSSLVETMTDIMDHQSHEATDIRFVAFFFHQLSGKFYLMEEQVKLLGSYAAMDHSDERMHIARPTVRSLEMMVLTFMDTDSEYLREFWRCVSEMTECSLFTVDFPEENRNITAYMEKLHDIFVYLSNLFVSIQPLDEKMNVLLGIATYSYKRFKEAYEHHLFNSIAGRSCVRVLIENYIMMKYLIKNEATHENIWRDYQLYGLGQYKLILTRHREAGLSDETHFDPNYIAALVSEFKDEEFINMDTKYFDKHNIRIKADTVDEKQLYGLYYDYDSAFEHGLWGAIRESSLLKCNNPAHKYHCVPDVEDQVSLKTVLPDCIMVMNRTLAFLNEQYGIPDHLLREVIGFEIGPFVEENP